MTSHYDDTDSPTQVGEISGAEHSRITERRPVLIALGGELLATPIPLELPEVTLGRALEAESPLSVQTAIGDFTEVHVSERARERWSENERRRRESDRKKTVKSHSMSKSYPSYGH